MNFKNIPKEALDFLQRLEAHETAQNRWATKRLELLHSGRREDRERVRRIETGFEDHPAKLAEELRSDGIWEQYCLTNGLVEYQQDGWSLTYRAAETAPAYRPTEAIPVAQNALAVSDLGREVLKLRYTRRTGRPKKTDKPVAMITLEALCDYHKFDNGVVSRDVPATGPELAKTANKGMKPNQRPLQSNALFRFLKGKDWTIERYKRACRNGHIGVQLQLWLGELPRREAELRDEEPDRAQGNSNKGRR